MWDHSAFVGRWPFRDVGDGSPEELELLLRDQGFGGAYVSPVDCLLHTDPAPANERWFKALRGRPFFRFVPLLNPSLPGWRDMLSRCRGEWNAAAVRLLPGYHGYAPLDTWTLEAVETAEKSGLPVYLQLRMQDPRSAHPLLHAPEPRATDALELARRCPDTFLVVAGVKWAEAQALASHFAELPRLYLEISHLEYIDGLARFVREWGAARLLVGTHAPGFTPAATRLKLETARLSAADRLALVNGNGSGINWGTPR